MRRALLLIALACQPNGNDPSPVTEIEAPLRVVFLSDTHVIGPQYTCCSESDGVDNASIVRTAERLAGTIERIQAIDPPPDHIFVLGDVVHDAHHGTDMAFYEQEETAWSIAADLFSRLDVPTHFVWGNHDYEVNCGGGGDHHPRAFTHQLMERFFGAPTHGSIEAGGWQFAMMNSQLGPTWDADDPACRTGFGSFGEEQLGWLDDLLSTGKPTIVMTHHHRLTSIALDENEGPNPDLYTVMARHPNTELHLAGHLHRWYELQATEQLPVPHLILGATRYDDDNFWLFEFEGDSYRIVDFDKPQWFTTCADTWDYVGPPMVTQGEEIGDCSL